MATVHHLTDTPERLELAACLDPGAVHTLNLLAGQGLLIYQDDGVDAHTGPAEIAVDSLLARVNRMGKPVSRRLVVWRREPFDLGFEFKLHTFEYLPVTVTLGLSLAIHEPKAFVARFLAGGEVVTLAALKRYLFEPLAQTLGEYLRGRDLASLAADSHLRPHLRTVLLPSDLEKRLAHAGLQLCDVHRLTLAHPAHDAARQQRGEIQLALENEQARQAAQAELDALYDKAEWANIACRESTMQRRIREQELALDEREQTALHRERELNILARVAAADTQEAALKLISENELDKVRHQLLGERMGREGEVEDWQHLRALATRRRNQELERLDDEHRRERARQDASAEAEIAKIRREQERADLALRREHLAGLQALDAAIDRQEAGGVPSERRDRS